MIQRLNSSRSVGRVHLRTIATPTRPCSKTTSSRVPVANLALEPRFREAPIALHGIAGYAKRRRRLVKRQPAEISELDDLDFARVNGRELEQRPVERHKIELRVIDNNSRRLIQ